MMLEKLNIHMQKNEIRPLSYTINPNQLKMDWRPECKAWNCKTLGKKHLDTGLGSKFSDMTPT